MKVLGQITTLLVVLALCLPSYGEVLVYKLSASGSEYEQVGQDQWDVERFRWKSYLVLDLDYTNNTIEEAAIIDYGTEDGGKWFEIDSLDGLELVRVVQGANVTWALVDKDVEMDGAEILGGGVTLLTGAARARSVGTGTNREVANKISGTGVWDHEEHQNMGFSTISSTLYPAWTYWANGADGGNQDFDATVDMIAAYLVDKGYTEEID